MRIAGRDRITKYSIRTTSHTQFILRIHSQSLGRAVWEKREDGEG